MTREMTSKERIIRALMLEEPDRVPVSFYEVNPYDEDTWRLRHPAYLRYVEYAKKSDIFAFKVAEMAGPQTVGGIETGRIFYTESEKIMVRKDGWRVGNSAYCKTTVTTPKGELNSITRQDDGVATTWTVKYFLENEGDIEKFFSIPYGPLTPNLARFYKAQRSLGEGGLMLLSLEDPLCAVASLFRYENFLREALASKSKIMELLKLMHERLYDFYESLSRRVQQTVFRICGPEYVSPPVLSSEFFDEFVVRFDRELVKVVKDHGNFACIHCHGKLDAVLEKIAAMKTDALEPLEPPPSGDLPLNQIKKRIGDKICLMGYIQYRDLANGSKDEIERKCREAIEMGAEGGGYVILPTAGPITAPSERELENHKQLLISAKKYGKYSLKRSKPQICKPTGLPVGVSPTLQVG